MSFTLNKTQILNFLYALTCAVVALGAEVNTLPMPASWRHTTVVAAIWALWLKSHWNFFVDPSGKKLPDA